ncbi:hypothetical protein FDP41_001569 [Naegleria fowleri]|uniref:BROMI C-terminal Rab TBC-like domain-containing protein n=1 Tax=Naegleria fowleri TaxID=5763 RepID=A0A6A5BVD7_NAEFO|nr:uncharacterized protein FDP41_001569 [Naegleria fowleri]KAF0979226.1 hypothetical protein FDP41_001569 [Naegleria fowleri]
MKKRKTINARSIKQVLEKLQQRYKVFSFDDFDRKLKSDGVERDLLSMERLDAQFHKYDIVSAILSQIENVFTKDVIQKINQQGEDSLLFDIMSGSVNFGEQLINSPKFEHLLLQVLAEVDRAIIEFKEHGWKKESKSSHTSSTRDTTSPSADSEFYWENFVNQKSHMFESSDRRKELAKIIGNKSMETNARVEAAKELHKMFAADIVSNEHWNIVLENVTQGLSDDEHEELRNLCVAMYKNFFKVSPPEATAEIHINLLNHLIERISQYQESSLQLETIESNHGLLDSFKVLLQFNYEVPKNWLCFFGDTSKTLLEKTFTLLSNRTAYYFLSYLDTENEWFSSWMKEFKIRKKIIKLLPRLEFLNRVYEGLSSTSKNQKTMTYFVLTHSSAICSRLLQNKDCKSIIDYKYIIQKLCESFMTAIREQEEAVIDAMHYRRLLSITKQALINMHTVFFDVDYIAFLMSSFVSSFEINMFTEQFITAICEICNNALINHAQQVSSDDIIMERIFSFLTEIFSSDSLPNTIKLHGLDIFKSITRIEQLYDKIESTHMLDLVIEQKNNLYDKVMHILLHMTQKTRGLVLLSKYEMLDECVDHLFSSSQLFLPHHCYTLSQVGCVRTSYADVALNYIPELIDKEKLIYDQFDWTPETERKDLDHFRYDITQILLLSPFSYEISSVVDQIWSFVQQEYECDCVFGLQLFSSLINNLNAAASLYSSNLWKELLKISFSEDASIIDEPSYLRNSIVQFCTTVGGKSERREQQLFPFSTCKASVTFDGTEFEGCPTLSEVLQSNSILEYRSFITNTCLVSVTVPSKDQQECGNQNIGSFGLKYLASYFKSVYGEERHFDASQSWSKILATLLFGNDVEKVKIFLANNPFLDLIDNNQNVILEIVSNVESILCEEFPIHYNSYVMCGLSICNIVTRWLRQLFFNFLDLRCIFQLLALMKEFGWNALIFICVLLLKRAALFDFCQEYKLESWTMHVFEPLNVDGEWFYAMIMDPSSEFFMLKNKYKTPMLSFDNSKYIY